MFLPWLSCTVFLCKKAMMCTLNAIIKFCMHFIGNFFLSAFTLTEYDGKVVSNQFDINYVLKNETAVRIFKRKEIPSFILKETFSY